jgi:hypothetical protein
MASFRCVREITIVCALLFLCSCRLLQKNILNRQVDKLEILMEVSGRDSMHMRMRPEQASANTKTLLGPQSSTEDAAHLAPICAEQHMALADGELLTPHRSFNVNFSYFDYLYGSRFTYYATKASPDRPMRRYAAMAAHLPCRHPFLLSSGQTRDIRLPG